MITKDKLPKSFCIRCNGVETSNKVISILKDLGYNSSYHIKSSGVRESFFGIGSNSTIAHSIIYPFGEKYYTYQEFIDLIQEEDKYVIYTGPINSIIVQNRIYKLEGEIQGNKVFYKNDFNKLDWFNKCYLKFSTKEEYLKQENKMENKIIGYKAPFDMSNGVKKGELYQGHKQDKYIANTEYYYHFNEVSSVCPIPKEIVEQWEPVYKEKYTLPVISNYTPTIDTTYIQYGCAKFHKEFFKGLQNINDSASKDNGANRMIESFKLDSGVEITMEQVKQICEYLYNM